MNSFLSRKREENASPEELEELSEQSDCKRTRSSGPQRKRLMARSHFPTGRSRNRPLPPKRRTTAQTSSCVDQRLGHCP